MSIARSLSRYLFGAALLFATLALPVRAEVTDVSQDPAVTVDVPAGFETKAMTRGIQAKTPDAEVFVWFETFAPDELDGLIKEHNEYWTSQGVALGDNTDQFKKEFGGKSVTATDYKGATWKDKPTVIRYLAIDAGLPGKQRVLMSMWASPEGDKAHDADVTSMIGSLKIKE